MYKKAKDYYVVLYNNCNNHKKHEKRVDLSGACDKFVPGTCIVSMCR